MLHFGSNKSVILIIGPPPFVCGLTVWSVSVTSAARQLDVFRPSWEWRDGIAGKKTWERTSLRSHKQSSHCVSLFAFIYMTPKVTCVCVCVNIKRFPAVLMKVFTSSAFMSVLSEGSDWISILMDVFFSTACTFIKKKKKTTNKQEKRVRESSQPPSTLIL